MAKQIIEIIKTEYNTYKILQDGHYEKIDGCLCGNSEIEKEWKTVMGAFGYCIHYADVIKLPTGSVWKRTIPKNNK